MPTYLGWNVISIPATPAAPQSVELTQVTPVAINVSPFTGQQQIQDWGNSGWMEGSIVMPPMKFSDAQAWVTFFRNLRGQACVFQFTAAFMSTYSGDVGSRYWRLKSNRSTWSIDRMRIYGFQFEIREAL